MPIVIDSVLTIARAAGDILMKHFGEAPDPAAVTLKADESPLSEADLESHEFLCGELKGLNPGISIISEEGVAADANAPTSYWLVDPLDGTREFIKRSPEFTVNIALVESGVVQLGVVHVPVRNVTYFAEKGKGAYRTTSDKERLLIRSRPAGENLVGFASRSHGGAEEARLTKAWPKMEIRKMASALKLCLIAEGEADFYVREHVCMAWDTAAAQLILEEAGGALLTLDGKPLTYDRNRLANPSFVAIGDPTFPWRKY